MVRSSGGSGCWFGDSQGDGGWNSSHGAMRLVDEGEGKKTGRRSGWEQVGFILVVCCLERCWDASRYLRWWSLRHHFDGLGCSS